MTVNVKIPKTFCLAMFTLSNIFNAANLAMRTIYLENDKIRLQI